MKKDDIQRHLNAFDMATGRLLQSVRDSATGQCLCCKAGTGFQHAKTCAVWPLIEARMNLRKEQDDGQQIGLSE
jgi:hypothetical protein